MVYEEGSYIQRYVYGLNGERTSAEFFYYDETERTTDLINPGENPASDFASEDISKIYYFSNLLDSTMLAMDRNGEIITHMTYGASHRTASITQTQDSSSYKTRSRTG